MNGLLSQVDPKAYPSLETITGEDAEKAKSVTEVSQGSEDDIAVNARLWCAVLDSANQRAAKRR